MLAKPKLLTPPVNRAVSLIQVKDFLKVDGTSEDETLKSLIKAATQRIELYIDKKIVDQSWNIFFNNFSKANGKSEPWWDGVKELPISALSSCAPSIKLPFGNLKTVTSFKTFDDADQAYVFSSSNYNVDTNGDYGMVVLKSGAVWPATTLRTINGICVEAVFGFGAGAASDASYTTTTPEDITNAIVSFVSILFERRGDELPTIPVSVMLLLEAYKTLKVR